MSYRSDVVDQIAPLLPADWDVLPYSDEPDVLDRVVVMVSAAAIEAGITASTYAIEMHTYVLTPNRDDVALDSDAVDDAVLLTLHALLRMRAVIQGRADRATFQGGHPCWDITITIEATIEDDTP